MTRTALLCMPVYHWPLCVLLLCACHFCGMAAGFASADEVVSKPSDAPRDVAPIENPVTTGTPVPLFGPDLPSQEPAELQSQKEARFRQLKRQLEELNERWKRGVPSETPPQAGKASGKAAPQRQQQPLPILLQPGTEVEPQKTTAAAGPNSNESGPQPPVPDPEIELPSAPRGEEEGLPAAPPVAEQTPSPDSVIDNGKPGSQTFPPTVPVNETPQLNDSAAIAETVQGPIDRFGLAMSLLGADRPSACLKVLEESDLSTLDKDDQVFAEYMQACCFRKLGRIDEARQVYRRLLAEPQAGWIGDLARWWLDNLDEKIQLTSDVNRLSETLSAWEKEIATLSQ